MKKFLGFGSAALALLISGCAQKNVVYGKPDNTPYDTKACNKALASGSEVLKEQKIDKIVVFKSKRKLYTYKKGKVVDVFRISLGKNGDKGPKVAMGDYKTPEGDYCIVRKKCDPRLYKSLMISYPSARDIALAKEKGVDPGNYITIHGQPKWNADGHGDKYTLAHDWTEGCMAVSNSAMDDLWCAVEVGVTIEIHA
ncbi:MAG: L,D-transpeptidase family protein [Campylobacterales bacterium]|nr:L,D-transpeptidase family protein [Campylobacterales bacterium]